MVGFTDLISNIDEEKAQQILGNMDEDDVADVAEWITEELVLPHLEEIRNRAGQQPSTEEVRRYYEEMDPQQREQEFYETLDALVATLVMCRERPMEGYTELKTMIRDPYTVEALLLIFENEDHIDPEYSEQMKDFGAEHFRWVGAMVLPEMYEPEEVERVLETFNINPESEAAGQQQS